MVVSKEKIVVFGLAVFFFLIYSWFGFATAYFYNSPDELANYFFIKNFAERGDFFAAEPLNYFLNNSLHPRSISDNGVSLVPQGFLGLPLLYGAITKLFSLNFLIFITPLFAVLGALCFYQILRRIFSPSVALLSFFLLLIFPGFWYYSSRHLYPNVPFAALLLISVWAAIAGALNSGGRILHLIIFSVTSAAAFALRPIEFVWIAPIFLFLCLYYRKKIAPLKVFFSLAIIFFILLPVLQNNLILYGHPVKSGYLLKSAATEAAPNSVFISLKKSFLPFGFYPQAIWDNFKIFILKFFWWYSWPAILGILVWIFGKKTKEEKLYFAAAVLSSIWLLFFYGSGVFSDNPNFGRTTIGDSHFRYWLPIFIFAIPFAAKGMIVVSEFFRNQQNKKIILTAFIVFMILFSIYEVYFSIDDGLRQVKNNLKNNLEIKSAVLNLTTSKDIIITGRQDKIFFPERKVLHTFKLDDPKLILNIHHLNDRNFYYYAIALSREEFLKISLFLPPYGFELKRIQIFGKEVLYKLGRINKNIGL